MRRLGVVVAALVAACSGGGDPNPPPGLAPVVTNAQVDDKSRLYNLIGRWYPSTEVQRLKDETLTPEEWCARPPTRLTVLPDSVEAHCGVDEVHSAPLARVKTTTVPGEVLLLLRVGKDAAMRVVRFEQVDGPRARVAGSPCNGGAATEFERFPEYEILTRQILNGRRCSQIDLPQPASPTPSP